jgi:hypothetical protein
MSKETGGPAFPLFAATGYTGMTLRDYFAVKAMQGQVNNPLKLGDDEAHRLIAERAYRMADAMLKAREQ